MSRPGELKVAALLVAGGIGLVLGLVIGDVPRLTLQTAVDPVALLALLMGALATLVVFLRLEKQKHKEQLRKEVTIERIRDCREQLERLEVALDSGVGGAGERKRATKRFRMCGLLMLEYASELSFNLGSTEIADYHSWSEQLWTRATEKAAPSKDDVLACHSEIEKLRRLLGKWERLVILEV